MTVQYAPSVMCLFCEDVREEATGQMTLVGVFPTRIDVESFPITLPRLVVHALVRTSIQDPPGSISLRLHLPWEQEPRHFEGPDDDWIAEKASIARESDDSALFLGMEAHLNPFEIKGPGKIRAFVVIDGTEHRAGSVNFQIATDDDGDD